MPEKFKVSIASDHAGFEMKNKIIEHLENHDFSLIDRGPANTDSVDYPDFAHLLSKKMRKNIYKFGFLICGSGIGMDMAANKHKNIRAALCYNVKSAKLSREHNNANVLALGARFTKTKTALKCVNTFINTNFSKGRHSRRVRKI